MQVTKARHHGIVRDKARELADALQDTVAWPDSLSFLNQCITYGEQPEEKITGGAKSLLSKLQIGPPKAPQPSGKQSSSTKRVLDKLIPRAMRGQKKKEDAEKALQMPLLLFVLPPSRFDDSFGGLQRYKQGKQKDVAQVMPCRRPLQLSLGVRNSADCGVHGLHNCA